MGRWPVVQARKNAVNAEKWKIFSIHAKLIALAAQTWWNIDDNPTLAGIVYKAKKDGVPNDTIERAIKKWTGEDKESAQISEIIYEWYAPGWVALMISTLTDNKNRTVSNIRHIFMKYWGNMWESWAVSWMFHKKWIIFIDPLNHSFDILEELVLETNAENILEEAGYIKIISDTQDFLDIEKFLINKDIEIFEAKIDYVYDVETEIDDFDKALKFIKMLEAFEEDEDVSTVCSNEIIATQLQNEVIAFIEKNSFRT